MMRKRREAKILAVIMAISACLPMNSNALAAYAAENADAGAVVAEEAENGGTQEAVSAAKEEISAEEKENPTEEGESAADPEDIVADEISEITEESAVTDATADSADYEEADEEDEKDSEQVENEEEGSGNTNLNDEYLEDDEADESLETEESQETAHGVMQDGNKSVIQSGTCGTNLKWSIEKNSDDDLMILKITGTGKMSDYSFDGAPWSEYAYDIGEVYVSEGVESIGDFAFYNMDMYSVTLPDSVQTIGLRAFEDCIGITEISLPDNLSFIDAWAFSGCDGLISIEFPEREIEVNHNAFSYCDSLQTIIIPEGIQFEDDTFGDCPSIKNVYISKDAKLLVATNDFVDIFSNCSKELTITGYTYSEAYYFALYYNFNFESIGEVALTGDCGENLQWDLSPDTRTLIISGSGEMYDYVGDNDSPWTYCQDLVEHIIVNEGVTSIGAYAFYQLDNLIDISMPDSVEELRMGCISYNDHISQIEIPKGVKKIHCKAILACPSLKKLIYNAVESEFVPNDEYTSDIEKQFAVCDSDRGMKYTPGNSITELTIGRDVKP